MTKKNGVVVEQHDATEATCSQEARERRFDFDKPYTVDVEIEGTCDIVFHRYDCAEYIASVSKAGGKKGSASKKTDNVPAYVYRVPGTGDSNDANNPGEMGIPAYALKACLVYAGKSFKDPRNARARASEILKASILVEPPVPSLNVSKWDYEDIRPCVIQTARVPRVRPALKTGWKLGFQITVTQPEFITVDFLREIVENAGRFAGLFEMRPDYGRFKINKFEVMN